MAAISSITLTDATPVTPVNHTFTPQDCTSVLATWHKTAGGIAIGMPTATLSVTRNANGYNVKGKLALAVLEVQADSSASGYDAPPKVAFESLGKFEFNLPARSSLQNRKDLKAMLRDFLSDAVVDKAVEDYERPF